MIRVLVIITSAIVFIPAMCIGFIVECAMAGFDTGREVVEDVFDKD